MTGKYIKRKVRNAKKWIAERPYYIRRAWNRKRIKSRDFTIISNNCWAGRCYQYLGMPYLAPTVGLYFFAEDYLNFVANLKHYLDSEIRFIPSEKSRYVKELKERNQLNVPIGQIDDVEIVFLHYRSEEEAREKWNRRKERVNYNNIYLKFSKMNLCEEKHMKQFDELNFENKFMFNNRRKKKYSSEFYWKGPGDDREIASDTKDFPGNIKLTSVLKSKAEKYPEEGLKL